MVVIGHRSSVDEKDGPATSDSSQSNDPDDTPRSAVDPRLSRATLAPISFYTPLSLQTLLLRSIVLCSLGNCGKNKAKIARAPKSCANRADTPRLLAPCQFCAMCAFAFRFILLLSFFEDSLSLSFSFEFSSNRRLCQKVRALCTLHAHTTEQRTLVARAQTNRHIFAPESLSAKLPRERERERESFIVRQAESKVCCCTCATFWAPLRSRRNAFVRQRYSHPCVRCARISSSTLNVSTSLFAVLGKLSILSCKSLKIGVDSESLIKVCITSRGVFSYENEKKHCL